MTLKTESLRSWWARLWPQLRSRSVHNTNKFYIVMLRNDNRGALLTGLDAYTLLLIGVRCSTQFFAICLAPRCLLPRRAAVAHALRYTSLCPKTRQERFHLMLRPSEHRGEAVPLPGVIQCISVDAKAIRLFPGMKPASVRERSQDRLSHLQLPVSVRESLRDCLHRHFACTRSSGVRRPKDCPPVGPGAGELSPGGCTRMHLDPNLGKGP